METFKKYGYEVRKIYDNTYRIMDNDACSSYLIIGSKKCMLVDTGCASGDLRKLVDEICQNKEYFVINTHGHDDHVAANYQFDKVYIGKEDEQMMKNLFLYEKEKEIFYEEMKTYASATADIHHFSTKEYFDNFANAKITFSIEYLKDGMLFDLGDSEIKAIHIPGHTPGGYCFLDIKYRRLYVGDAVLRHASVLHVGGMKISDFINGLKKLKTYASDFDWIIAAHGHRQHGFRPLEPFFIDKLIECAENIDVSKSIERHEADGEGYEYYLNGGRYEDYDSVSIAYKLTSLD